MTEAEVNAALRARTAFNDPATLRRDLVGLRLIERTRDGSVYRRNPATPPPEAQALFRWLGARRTA